MCVCVGVRTGRLISPRQPPILLNRKCLDLEQQKTRPNPREKARAPPPTQTSSLFIYTETPATVKLPPPEFTHATICRGAFNSLQNKDLLPRSQPEPLPSSHTYTHTYTQPKHITENNPATLRRLSNHVHIFSYSARLVCFDVSPSRHCRWIFPVLAQLLLNIQYNASS